MTDKSGLAAVPEYVHRAHEKKLKAEAKAARASARFQNLEAASAELSLELQTIQTAAMLRATKFDMATDASEHIYRFAGPVMEDSVKRCMDTLHRWQRTDADRREGTDEEPCDIEIVFYTPGGGLTEGMALFDTIRNLSKAGHKITTTAVGEAASMGAILLQAGDVRRMTAESWLMIHEVSFGAQGSASAVGDRTKWVERIHGRLIDIFTKRMEGAPTSLTKDEFKERWERRDWWLDAEEALQFGVVDAIV